MNLFYALLCCALPYPAHAVRRFALPCPCVAILLCAFAVLVLTVPLLCLAQLFAAQPRPCYVVQVIAFAMRVLTGRVYALATLRPASHCPCLTLLHLTIPLLCHSKMYHAIAVPLQTVLSCAFAPRFKAAVYNAHTGRCSTRPRHCIVVQYDT